jgi:hypothetical protein
MGIYVWKSLRGEARPHPLSWLIFGVLTGTGYLVPLDQKAGPGSWVMAITTIVCFLLSLMSFWRGERTFPWYEWRFSPRPSSSSRFICGRGTRTSSPSR